MLSSLDTKPNNFYAYIFLHRFLIVFFFLHLFSCRWNVFRARLFRESCVYHRGNYVKDLNKLGRDLQKIVIVDNSPASYIFHPDNAVSFFILFYLSTLFLSFNIFIYLFIFFCFEKNMKCSYLINNYYNKKEVKCIK